MKNGAYCIFLSFLGVEILKFKCMNYKTSQSSKNEHFQPKSKLGQICLSWLWVDSKVSFEPMKSELSINLVIQSLQKIQNWWKMTKDGGLELFEWWSDIHQKKPMLSYYQNSNFFFNFYDCFFDLLIFEILSFKNVNFCTEIHLIKITTVLIRCS